MRTKIIFSTVLVALAMLSGCGGSGAVQSGRPSTPDAREACAKAYAKLQRSNVKQSQIPRESADPAPCRGLDRSTKLNLRLTAAQRNMIASVEN